MAFEAHVCVCVMIAAEPLYVCHVYVCAAEDDNAAADCPVLHYLCALFVCMCVVCMQVARPIAGHAVAAAAGSQLTAHSLGQ